MAKRKLEVEILGDAKDLERALGKAGKGTDKLSKKNRVLSKGFSALGKAAKVGAVAGLAAIGATAVIGAKGLIEDEKALNKVSSALKSTGGAANVSKKDIQDHASSLQSLTGVGADQIMTNQSLLLTFTNVRKEAGKGNDIFKRGTEIALDMSTAMGTDMKESTIQVGKALNDPIKGLGSLSRVGVQFTDQQREQITTLVESGKTMEAQKVILGELETQFGGTAKAMGETTEGQMKRAKAAFEEVAKKIMAFVLPAITAVSTWLINEGIPAFERFTDFVGRKIKEYEPQIRAFFQSIVTYAKAAMDWYEKNIAPTIEKVVEYATAFWNEWGDDIQRVLAFIIREVKRALTIVRETVELVMALLRGDWSEAWNSIQTILTTLWASMIDKVKTLGATLVAIVFGIGRDIATRLMDGLRGLGDQVKNFLRAKIVDPWAGIITSVFNQVKKIPGKIMEGLRTAFSNLDKTPQGWLISKLVDVIPGVVGKMKAAVQKAPGKIMEGLTDGFNALAQSPLAFLTSKLVNIWSQGDGIISRIKAKAGDAANGIATEMKTILDEAWKKPANSLIGGINSMIGAIDAPLKFVSLPRVKKFARGGVVDQPHLGIFGEAGPEALIPMGHDKKRYAMPLLQQAAAAHGMQLVEYGIGGWIKDSAKAVAGTVKGWIPDSFDALRKGAGYFIDLMPSVPSVGPRIGEGAVGTGVAKDVWGQVKDWIREMVPRVLKKAVSFLGTGGDTIPGATGGVFSDLVRAASIANRLAGGGFMVTSGLRNSTVKGTGRPSRHNSGDALDISKGGWPGSIDPLASVISTMFGVAASGGFSSNGGANWGFRTHIGGNHFNHGHLASTHRPTFTKTLGNFLTGKLASGNLSFHSGTPYVPRTGPAMLSEGEAVLSPEMAARYRAGKGMIEKLADEVHFHEPEDAPRVISALSARLSTKMAVA